MADEQTSIVTTTGALTFCEQLIRRAEGGEKLSLEDRRLAVGYIYANYKGVTQREMARLFQCDEGSIRYDIRKLKVDRADTLREDTDVKVLISDLMDARDRVMTNLLRAMRKMEDEKRIDNATYIALNKEFYLAAQRTMEQLSTLGWLPKNAGTITVNKRVYKGVVQPRTGAVETRPLDLFDDMREDETLEQLLRRKTKEQREQIQDAEFEEIPVPALTDGSQHGEGTTKTEGSNSGAEGASEGSNRQQSGSGEAGVN